MTPKRFSWKPGRHYAVSAQKFGEWVEGLADRRPEAIISAARNPRCIAHRLFEWDSSRAAQQFRLIQARVLYGSLTVEVVVYERKKQRLIQAQAIIHASREGDYESIDVAMSDPPKRDFILAQAMAQLQATRRRYAHLSELAVIFSAVERVAKRIGKK